MPRLSPKELQQARRAKQAGREAAQEEVKRQLAEKRERLKQLEETRQQWDLLNSVLTGLYDEFDKLTKKAPADEITELGLRRVNELIRQAKQLLVGDPFIDSIDPFVAAGENPEHRDVLLVLREIRQGMLRQNSERERLRSGQRGW
jgi:DNA repair exonuclease SbcCD ATPase subunit